jgi:hypothetical protein
MVRSEQSNTIYEEKHGPLEMVPLTYFVTKYHDSERVLTSSRSMFGGKSIPNPFHSHPNSTTAIQVVAASQYHKTICDSKSLSIVAVSALPGPPPVAALFKFLLVNFISTNSQFSRVDIVTRWKDVGREAEKGMREEHRCIDPANTEWRKSLN